MKTQTPFKSRATLVRDDLANRLAKALDKQDDLRARLEAANNGLALLRARNEELRAALLALSHATRYQLTWDNDYTVLKQVTDALE